MDGEPTDVAALNGKNISAIHLEISINIYN
jgi:hypothetical protein